MSAELPGITLVCFALKTEAAPFAKLVSAGAGSPLPARAARLRTGVKTLVTGMGWDNAALKVRAALAAQTPKLVLSCGFAGGLLPSYDPVCLPRHLLSASGSGQAAHRRYSSSRNPPERSLRL